MASRTPNSPGPSPEPGAGRKRRRIALACDECRERKRKCDGVKPVCGACSRRSAGSCVWNEDRNNRAWTNSYVEGLRSRIRELEEAQALGNGAASVNAALSSAAAGRYSHDAASPMGLVDHFMPASHAIPEPYHSTDSAHVEPDAGSSSMGANSVSDSGSMSAMAGARFSFDSPGRAVSPFQRFREDSFDVFGSDSGETGVDGMGLGGSIEDGGGLHIRCRIRRPSDYFGPSSTMSLLSKARNVLGRRCSGHGQLASVGSKPCASCRAELASTSTTSRTSAVRESGFGNAKSVFGISLPPRTEADSLVESYWKWCHSLYPFVHRPSFSERYRAIWTTPMDPQLHGTGSSQRRAADYYDELSDRCFYCMLNVVFALGALFNPRIDDASRYGVSRSFFERGKKLLDLDLLAQGSIGLVQTLLLMGQYLQSSDMSSSCWNIVGLAIRVAQCIGLHHEPKGCEQGCCNRQEYDQLDTEMRQKTWAGCVLLDRLLSLTYGRPLMIHPTTTQKHMVLPSAIDDEFLTRLPDAPGSQPEGLPSVTECYVQTIKLQDILGQVLAAMYYAAPDHRNQGSASLDLGINHVTASINGDGAETSAFQALLDVDSLLTTWHKKLPTHLKVQTWWNPDAARGIISPAQAAAFHRQAVVLETRYLHVRQTMLRPVLSTLCDVPRGHSTTTPDDESIESNMRHGMFLKAAKLCISVTQELVSGLLEKAQSGSDLLPAPWYNVFYIHSSAMVFLLGYICSLKHASIMDQVALIEGFKRCLAFLRGYETQSPSAQKCSKILELVKQEVFEHRNDNNTVTLDASAGHIRPGEMSTGVAAIVADARKEDQPYPSSASQLGNDAIFSPGLNDEGNIDQAWMWNSSDMAWLSYMPFLDDQSNVSG